ncbi:hypothetical protein MMC15_008018, partial [Xylographa vitiligo]|nr:hypothetical protein [Xylographa vitiligo]
MATTLGKRKRRSQLFSPQPTSPSTNSHLQALFQQHFEAKYGPLPPPTPPLTTTTPTPPSAPPSSESSDQAWEGLSASSSSSPPLSPSTSEVRVISHRTPARSKRADVPRSELRAFMKPTPPATTAARAAGPASKPRPAAATADPRDRALLADDLALQRLLSESHLLHPQPPSSSSSHAGTPTPSARPGLTIRQRMLDLRIQALGAKRSVVGQQKMPMGVRRGMEAKRAGREE